MTETESDATGKLPSRVIRSKATGRYFVESATGAWVSSPNHASKFDRLSDMVETCQRHGLFDVDLVIESRYAPSTWRASPAMA